MKLMVGGGFDEHNKDLLKQQQDFAELLGREIILQGHVLLNACLTSFDSAVAESAYHTAKKEGKDPNKQIVSYVLPGQELAHEFGKILQSQLQNWELESPRLRRPEPIQLADAIILVGGFKGTYRAANWARIAQKPLLPVMRFGGTAEKVYTEELDDFERYRGRISKADYENLTQLKSPLDDFVKQVVGLAQMAQASRAVFVVMSFSGDPKRPELNAALEDVLGTYKDVCSKFDYICERVDDASTVPRILPEIWEKISECAFAIVDLSVRSANVYYELGYAKGQNKPVIVTAKKDTELPFDVKDIPVIFWENQTRLRNMLSEKIEKLQTDSSIMQ
jgi:hypothetical protein